MKIGILTLVLHTNYGGILQAYALQTILENMGHNVVVLSHIFPVPHTTLKIFLKRIVKKLLGQNVVVFRERMYRKEFPIISKDVNKFKHQYIHEKTVDTLETMKSNELDCIIVGSDQVWRPRYFKSQWNTEIENGYLAFTKKWHIKRISYAASLGVDSWEYSNKKTLQCKAAIKLFDAIAVRESSAIKLLEENLGANSQLVLDPTLLLEKEDYIKIIGDNHANRDKEGLLVCILDGNVTKKAIVDKVAKEKSLMPFSINNAGIPETAPAQQKVLPSVESWLSGFRDANFVVTDSFHGMVFSIIFNKPFICIANKERGLSRFTSLLNIFELENRLIFSIDDLSEKLLESIDYVKVNSIKKQWQEKSIQFLKENLEQQ